MAQAIPAIPAEPSATFPAATKPPREGVRLDSLRRDRHKAEATRDEAPMKTFLLQFFTWWNGQTLGTRFHTWRHASPDLHAVNTTTSSGMGHSGCT